MPGKSQIARNQDVAARALPPPRRYPVEQSVLMKGSGGARSSFALDRSSRRRRPRQGPGRLRPPSRRDAQRVSPVITSCGVPLALRPLARYRTRSISARMGLMSWVTNSTVTPRVRTVLLTSATISWPRAISRLARGSSRRRSRGSERSACAMSIRCRSPPEIPDGRLCELGCARPPPGPHPTRAFRPLLGSPGPQRLPSSPKRTMSQVLRVPSASIARNCGT